MARPKLSGLLMALTFVLAVTYFFIFMSGSVALPVTMPSETLLFRTARGSLSDRDVQRELYGPLGFEYVSLTVPIAIVKRTNIQTCEKIFEEWLEIASKYDAHRAPPQEIPVEYYNNFTMNGIARVKKWYVNDNSVSRTTYWSRSSIDGQVKAKKPAYGYDEEGKAVEQSTKYHNISGMTGLVIGSQRSWVEALCLRNGAFKVITVEYQKILTDHPQLGYFHPIEMAKNWKNYHEKFDFAVSFSSIEHSGLGRYGDPIDPIGDIREMQKIQCQLKKGGLFFLGIPTGADAIYYNAHRVYGRIRLPLMFEGYQLLSAFYRGDPDPHMPNQEVLEGMKYVHYVFVLRKL